MNSQATVCVWISSAEWARIFVIIRRVRCCGHEYHFLYRRRGYCMRCLVLSLCPIAAGCDRFIQSIERTLDLKFPIYCIVFAFHETHLSFRNLPSFFILSLQIAKFRRGMCVMTILSSSILLQVRPLNNSFSRSSLLNTKPTQGFFEILVGS